MCIFTHLNIGSTSISSMHCPTIARLNIRGKYTRFMQQPRALAHLDLNNNNIRDAGKKSEKLEEEIRISCADQSLFLCQPRIRIPHCHIHTKLLGVCDEIESEGAIPAALSE